MISSTSNRPSGGQLRGGKSNGTAARLIPTVKNQGGYRALGGRKGKGDQNQLANSGEVSTGKKRRHSKTSSNVLGEGNIGAGVQCMASLGLKRYPGTSGGKKVRNGSTSEKKKVTPMKGNMKKARTKEVASDKKGAYSKDTQARGEDLPEEAMTIRGGVFTREDLLVDISQRLKVMRRQEASHYTIPDYLKAEFQQKLREAAEANFDSDDVEKAAAESSAAVPSSVGDAAASAALANEGAPAPAANGSSSTAGSSTNSTINDLWREKICEWCYQVVDHFDFNREVVSVAMNYLDRYLAIRTVNRRIFQLAAMTALYLAIKLFEPGKLRMSSLIDLSRGYFMAEHIVTMEQSMLKSLKWHVHPPTPFAFCRDFMRLVSGDISPRARHDVNELARFMTELSVCDYWFITKKPSSIALAALINAIELQGPRRVDQRYKVEFLHRVVELGMDIASDDEIIECYERLREMYIAGGYTPNLEEPSTTSSSHVGENGSRVANASSVATVSPTGVADGPNADDLNDDGLSQMECV